MDTCSEDDCGERAAFELHVPWADNRPVCAGHARVLARRDGVVADPLDSADDELPEGAG
jgi:hypothetical protein